MATRYGIVYATSSKALRRIILTDNDATLIAALAGPGETFLLANRVDGYSLDAAKNAIKQATGVKSPNLECAVLDKDNKVTAIILADPTLDNIKDYVLKESYPGVNNTCTFDPAQDLFVAPIKTILAGTLDKNGNPLLEDKITGGPIPRPV